MTMPIEKLLHVLVQKGILSPGQLDECLRESRSEGRNGTETELTDIIVSRGYVDRDTMSSLRKGAVPPSLSSAVPELPPEVIEARKDPKRVIQKYTLLNEVGRGGMAVVYRAWDDLLRTFVALKLIRSQDVGIGDAAKESEVQEFAREARTALKLSHPNIVRVYELGKHDDRYFLSMEYVDGKNLETLLHPSRRQSPWHEFHAAPRKFLVILRDVAHALDHAHHQKPPIVHRDVKPQNILVDGRGRACVVDFGLAKEMKSGSTITVSGIVKGTPCYMAPEQALGRTGSAGVDARTDVWALGAILYQYLAGVPPFVGPTQREILNKVVTEEPVPPSELHRRRESGVAVPAELEKICLKALEKEKVNRYAGAGEFARELDRYLGGVKVKARGVAGYERVLRKAGRNKTVVVAVSIAVVMAIVAAAALMRPRDPERVVEKAPPAETATEKPKRPPEETPAPAEPALDPEEARFRDALIAGLVGEIRKGPRNYPKFSLKDRNLTDVRLLDATNEALALRTADRIVEVPWGQLAEWQLVFLVNEHRDALDGDALLGFVGWCIRHRFTNEAVTAARILRGKSMSPAAQQLFAQYTRRYELDQEPEIVRKTDPPPVAPAPVPAPAPRPTPPPAEPVPVRKVAPPVQAAPEIRAPELPVWTYRSEWKNHGPVLAAELVRLGWDDLAEELVLNTVNSPVAKDREKDEAVLVRSRLWSAQAEREEKVDEAVLKLNWAIKTLEGMLGRSIDGEVRTELCSLHSAKGRLLMSGGRTADAVKSFAALQETAKMRLAEMERNEGPQPGKEEWLQAKLAPALAMFAEADAFASTVSVAGDTRKSYERLLNHLEKDVLWSVEGTAVGVHANLLRSAARANLLWPSRQQVIPQSPTLPSVVSAWMADPAFARSEAGRWLLPRAVLLHVSLGSPEWPPLQGDGGATAKWYGDLARSLEDVIRKFPQAKEGQLGEQLRLHLARAHVRNGRALAAMPILKSLLGPDASGALKSTVVRILNQAGTLEAKQLILELNVPAATTDLPLAVSFLHGIVPRGATPVSAGTGFLSRQPALRDALIARGGATPATQAAVQYALRWLARHQDPDGGWSAAGFSNRCSGGKCGGPGDPSFEHNTRPMPSLRLTPVFPGRNDCSVPEEEVVSAGPATGDVGVTGLALLAFLGAGSGPHSNDPFGEVVKRGLQWLIRQQDPEGCVGERGAKCMITHAIAGQALAEAYGLTGWSVLKEPAQKALDFTLFGQNPGKGWRYSAQCGDNDTVATGFAVQQLRCAEAAELPVPRSAYDGVLIWLNESTEQNGYYQAGYNARSTAKVYIPGKNEQFDHHAAMTAVGVLSRLLLSKGKADQALAGVNLLVSDLPEWKTNKIDFYYWHYASMALFAYDGPDGPMWKKWNEPMKNALVPNQKTGKDDCKTGSWDPDQERWGSEGGRVYATAINALTLETYYRFGVPLPVTRKK